MRLLGALLLISASTAFGILMSAQLNQRVRKLESVILYFDALREEMRQSEAELPDLLSRVHRDVYIQNGEWCGITELSGEEKQVLSSFLRSLGTTDMEGQLKNIASHKALIDSKLSDAREQKKNLSRLYVSLGFFFGLFVAIIMI